MFKTLLTLLAFASLTIVTRSYAQSDLPPLADQVDRTPTPLPTAAPLPGKWLTNENEAINQAAQQGKVILVDFDADWCSWCTKMHNEVLSRDRFKEFAADNLILLRLDYPVPETRRSPEAVALYNQYHIQGFPTLLLINAKAIELSRQVGYSKESVILQWLRTNVSGGVAADSAASDQIASPRRQVDQMQAIMTALAYYDWQTLKSYFIDGQTNYFGHRNASIAYIVNDIQNDSRQFGRQNWTIYWNTFRHENDGNMAYDSVNAYVMIEEPAVRLHRALERLTIGYAWDPNAVHGIIIHSITLKVLR